MVHISLNTKKLLPAGRYKIETRGFVRVKVNVKNYSVDIEQIKVLYICREKVKWKPFGFQDFLP